MRPLAFDFTHEWVTLRWRFGWLVARWDNGVWAIYGSWAAALGTIYHPLNDHVRIRIRSGNTTQGAE